MICLLKNDLLEFSGRPLLFFYLLAVGLTPCAITPRCITNQGGLAMPKFLEFVDERCLCPDTVAVFHGLVLGVPAGQLEADERVGVNLIDGVAEDGAIGGAYAVSHLAAVVDELAVDADIELPVIVGLDVRSYPAAHRAKLSYRCALHVDALADAAHIRVDILTVETLSLERQPIANGQVHVQVARPAVSLHMAVLGVGVIFFHAEVAGSADGRLLAFDAREADAGSALTRREAGILAGIAGVEAAGMADGAG